VVHFVLEGDQVSQAGLAFHKLMLTWRDHLIVLTCHNPYKTVPMVSNTGIVSDILIMWHIMALYTLSLPFVITLTVSTSHALLQMQ